MDDPRLTPARPDLAAKYLEGKVKAARFAIGETFEISDAIAPLREEPSSDAWLLTQALKGERATIYDRNGEGWAWGQLNRDGYVGWLPDRALRKPPDTPTHKVTALLTFAFPGPSIKLPPAETILLHVAVARAAGAGSVQCDLDQAGTIDSEAALAAPQIGRADEPLGHLDKIALKAIEIAEMLPRQIPALARDGESAVLARHRQE